MWKGRSIWEQMIEHTVQDTENCLADTIVEIAGERRVLVENHRGVAAYSQEKILVKVKYGSLCICGCNLQMHHMTKDQLVVFGKIHNVSLHRRDTI